MYVTKAHRFAKAHVVTVLEVSLLANPRRLAFYDLGTLLFIAPRGVLQETLKVDFHAADIKRLYIGMN